MTTSRPALTEHQIDDIDQRAIELVAIAHGDGDAGDVARLTADLDRAGLIGLAISCAALASPDRPVTALLAWLPDPHDPREGWTDDELRKAHAAYHRGDRAPRIQYGERIYQRTRKLRRTNTTSERRSA